VYQQEPLSGNPLAMSAGMAMLTHLHNHPEIFTSLAEVRVRHKGIAETLSSIDHQINRYGSMISVHLQINQ
jgi:glutamate-1-semialdehyde 2,1-aminomutase